MFPRFRIALDEYSGLIYSTVFAPDVCMYETAICDRVGTDVAERYHSLGEAIQGHKDWLNHKKDFSEMLEPKYEIYRLGALEIEEIMIEANINMPIVKPEDYPEMLKVIQDWCNSGGFNRMIIDIDFERVEE